MKRKLSRNRIIELAITVVAVVVVILLVLIGTGILRLPSTSPATVTVNFAQWNILQGNTKFGYGWFGQSPRYVNASDGLPISVTSGGTFGMSISLSNLDSQNHTIYTVFAGSPFGVVATNPKLGSAGATVISGSDDWVITVTLRAPSVSSDATYSLNITLNAIPS
jgi:hypothetical protein